MGSPEPSFATDAATATYYDRRAEEYDHWYLGTGLFAARERPAWAEELQTLIALVAGLDVVETLDVACGTGFLTQHVPGCVVAVDRSERMVALARTRVRDGIVAVADALALPLAAQSVVRVFTAHFYGHLPPAERAAFLDEVWRVGTQLVVVDSAMRDGVEPEQWQERVLGDGSRHRVFKRFLTADGLAQEIGGRPLFAGKWFVVASASRPDER